MAYLVICKDKKNSLDKRMRLRETHLKYLKSIKEKLIMAGPILDDLGNPEGSIISVDFKSIKELNLFLENDPYSKHKLFRSVEVYVFRKVF